MEVAALVIAASAFAGIAISKRPRVEGLQTVAEGVSPEVDIVFVHGLGGHPSGTWTTTNQATRVNWMRDLLPKSLDKSKQSRVLTYGYSSQLFSSSKSRFWGQMSRSHDEKVMRHLPQVLQLHSRRLLEELTTSRGETSRNRAIIFVCHSLGGLIVRDALVQASTAIGANSKYKAIELCTCGVLCFGTPIRDTSDKPWSNLLEEVVLTNLDLPTNLKLQPVAGSSDMIDLHLQRYRSIENNFRNYCFYETKIKDRGRPLIVPRESVVPKYHSDCWKTFGVKADHLNMVKFQNEEDFDYQNVLCSIVDCAEHATEASGSDKINNVSFSEHMEIENMSITKWENMMLSNQSESPGIYDPDLIQIELEPSTKDKEALYKRSIEESEAENGCSHRITIGRLERLADFYRNNREYFKAELLYKRIFVPLQDSADYGPWNRITASILQRIAQVQIEQGSIAEATEYLLRVKEIQIMLYGDDDPESLKIQASIAILYDKQKRWHEAEELYKKVIRARELKFGDHHEETLSVIENLALSYRLRGGTALKSAVTQYTDLLQRRKSMTEDPSCQGLEEIGDRYPSSERPRATALRERLVATVQKLAEVYDVMGKARQRRDLLKKWSKYIDDSLERR